MKGPEPGVFEQQLRSECGRREVKKGSSRSGSQRAGGPDPI